MARAPASVDAFFERLTVYRGKAAFNPWSEYARGLDLSADAPRIRRNHLEAYLRERIRTARVVLIGECPGATGARFSGIALTSERQLLTEGALAGESQFFRGPKARTSALTSELGMAEPTATIVWSTMSELGIDPRTWLAWNAFAIHPHEEHPLINRAPLASELKSAEPILRAFLDLVEGVPVVAVGRTAEKALAGLGIVPAGAVRHPSHGGASQFRDGIAALIEPLRLSPCLRRPGPAPLVDRL